MSGSVLFSGHQEHGKYFFGMQKMVTKEYKRIKEGASHDGGAH